ncbi:MAG: redoxin domain-containing protein [Sedimentisphaerales bacterium]|nr:redoxin domain-containing protein [Sedimentisphaerales bacterium]
MQQGWRLKIIVIIMLLGSIGQKMAGGQSHRSQTPPPENRSARTTDPNAPAQPDNQSPSSFSDLLPTPTDNPPQGQSPANAPFSRESLRAQQLVDKFIRRLRSYKSYSCRVTDFENLTHDSIQIVAQNSFTLTARRPNRLALVNSNGASLWSGAEGVVMFNPLTRQFSASEPVSNDLIWNSSEYRAVIGDIPLLNFILSSPQWQMLKIQPLEWAQLDDETINGVNCHHLTLTVKNIPIHLWFEADEEKTLRQVAVNLQFQASDKPEDGVIKSAARWTFDDWTFDTELDESLFKTTLPEDAWPESSNHLTGQLAPLFSAPMLNNQETLDISRHRDKQIVILDFWATWCGPCRQGLPILNRLAHNWGKDSVAVYAVNISDRDTNEQIHEFLQQNQIQLPVAIGHDPEIGQKYRVSGIPQTVIIGKNGIIQDVHVGLAPNMAELLQKQIADLLKGGECKGILAAPQADVSCSKVGFSTTKPGRPAAFWCEITNAGPDAIPTGRLAFTLRINKNKNLEDTHLVASPIAAGQTLRYEIPKEMWAFVFARDAKGTFELLLDPYGTLNDSNLKNNYNGVALSPESQKK